MAQTILKGFLWQGGRAVVVLVAFSGFLWSQGRKSPPPPNLVFIVADTLRADVLSSYGNPDPTSPALDALSRRSVLFEQAITADVLTPSSVGSLFVGYYPPVHRVGRGKDRVLASTFTTLAELLADRGYQTAAYTAYDFGRWGVTQGFEDERLVGGGVAGVFKEARGFLGRQTGEPFFLFLHYANNHTPYGPPSAFIRDAGNYLPYKAEQARSALKNLRGVSLSEQEALLPHLLVAKMNGVGGEELADDLWQVYYASAYWPEPVPLEVVRWKKLLQGWALRYPQHEALLYLRALYAGEARYGDQQLGLFLKDLEDQGFLKNTVLVFVSDHGEMLGEEGIFFHGETCEEPVLRVPLLIYFPGEPFPGRRVAAQVRTIDVLPTLLEQMGLSAPRPLQGRSLWPDIRSETSREALPALSYSHEEISFRKPPYKIIIDRLAGDVEQKEGALFWEITPSQWQGGRFREKLEDPSLQESLWRRWKEMEGDGKKF